MQRKGIRVVHKDHPKVLNNRRKLVFLLPTFFHLLPAGSKVIKGQLNADQQPLTHLAFLTRPLQNTLLDGPLADQPIHSHLFRLSQTMCTVLSLLIDGGIPIRVVEDYLQREAEIVLNSVTELWSRRKAANLMSQS